MTDERNPVRLQVAVNRVNIVAGGGGYRWAQVYEPFSNAKSAINYLSLNYDKLEAGCNVFQIIDSQGTVLMNDAAIRAEVRKR
jgi:hypothetical protein